MAVLRQLRERLEQESARAKRVTLQVLEFLEIATCLEDRQLVAQVQRHVHIAGLTWSKTPYNKRVLLPLQILRPANAHLEGDCALTLLGIPSS